MPVTVYRSTDASAPTLSGTVGDLVNVLDKCLVAGYGAKAAAGWTKPFTGANAASFRQGGGNSFYLDVNDNGPGAGGAVEARVRGYETMTAVATGTGLFPTAAQLAAGIIVRKSAAVSATTRVWTLVADDRSFYLFVQSGDTAGCWLCFCFGDFYSYLSGTDNFRTLIVGRVTENSATVSTDNTDKVSTGLAATTGHYVARSYTGLGGALNVGKVGDILGFTSVFGGTIATPNPADGNVWVAPVKITEPTATAVRGKMRGFMDWLHAVGTFTDQDTVTGAGAYAGHTFLLFKTTGNAAAYCVDIVGPWDTN
jgi:hypothetical protein